MFAVVSCKKYSRQTLRVVDYGDKDCKALLSNLNVMECPLCGPCSHVELTWHNWFIVHSEGYETQEQAIEAAQELDAANPDKYDSPFTKLANA